MVELGKNSSDPFWILVNTPDSFRVISQTNQTGGRTYSDSDDQSSQQKVLVIEKKFCKIYEKNYSVEDERRGLQNPISGLLGVLNIQGQNFIVVISEKQMIGKVDGANIFMIKNVDLIPFADDQSVTQIRNFIDGVKKLLTVGFYFSYNSDITSNRQRSANLRNKGLMGGDSQSIWESCDKRYFWNYNICQDFLYQKVDPRWIVPVIQGYVEYSSQIFDGKELEIILISRRRFSMAGTRYNARGLDDDGNVANYVETEQIMSYRNFIYSFVQIRGSVPLFWQQKGIQAHTSIKRDEALTAQAFDKHLNEMVNDYRLVIFINLLQKGRSNEYMLTEALEKLFQICQPKCVKYTYYDFHTETKGDNFHRLNDLMTKIEDMLVKKFLYFVEDRHTGKIVQEQRGVLRTNCLDCLDRTNVTQTKIALKIIENVLDKIKAINRKSQRQDDSLGLGLDSNNDAFIFDILKNMWAENGDMISKQYAGTSSTITSVTKTGKQGFMGKIDQMRRGVERFLVNNIEDGHKHECIKLMINQHPQQQQYGVKAQLEKQLEKYQNHFMSWQDITFNVVSWNCAGNTPPVTFDIGNILFQENSQQKADVFVIGLQEMVKLNAKSVIQGKDREKVMLWEKIITNSLCKRHRYVCVSKKPMVGCFVLLFIKDEHKNRINSIRTSKVKTGFGGQSGNKGSVAIRFNFDNSSFAFINCHLTSGQNQVSERLEDIREIYKKSFDCSQKFQDFMIQSHDYKFIFGDLNFRIALPYEVVKDEIRKQNYAYLQSKDQLLSIKSQNSILNRFNEGVLDFDPTYKYDDHSNTYDTSKKMRTPAWCDRILYEKSQKCGGNIELLRYGRRESYFSDHRPVSGLFQVAVCKIDFDKKQDIEYKLLDQLFPGTMNNKMRSQTLQVQSQQKIPLSQQQNRQNFNMMQVNIDDGYVDSDQPSLSKENSMTGTKAIDDLLGRRDYNNDNQYLTQSQAIDELLKSNTSSNNNINNSNDLITLSQQSVGDLIDLNFGSQNIQQHQQVIQNHNQQQNNALNQQRIMQPSQQTTIFMNTSQYQTQQSSQFNSQSTNYSNSIGGMNTNLTNSNMFQANLLNNNIPQIQQQQQQQPFSIQNNYIQSYSGNNNNSNQPISSPNLLNQQMPFKTQNTQNNFNVQNQFAKLNLNTKPISMVQPQQNMMAPHINSNPSSNNNMKFQNFNSGLQQVQQQNNLLNVNKQTPITGVQNRSLSQQKNGDEMFAELFGGNGVTNNSGSNGNQFNSNNVNAINQHHHNFHQVKSSNQLIQDNYFQQDQSQLTGINQKPMLNNLQNFNFPVQQEQQKQQQQDIQDFFQF